MVKQSILCARYGNFEHGYSRQFIVVAGLPNHVFRPISKCEFKLDSVKLNI